MFFVGFPELLVGETTGWPHAYMHDCVAAENVQKVYKTSVSILHQVPLARDGLQQPFGMVVIIYTCWNLWKQRNNKIFITPSQRFRTGAVTSQKIDRILVMNRIEQKHKASMNNWIQQHTLVSPLPCTCPLLPILLLSDY
jgi:hypothetical protein